MRSSIQSALVASLVLTSTVTTARENEPRSDDEIIQQVVKDLHRRQEQIASVRYTVDGAVFVPREAQSNLGQISHGLVPPRRIPISDSQYESSWTLCLDLLGGRARKELCTHAFNTVTNVYVPCRQIIVYDGSRLFIASPRNEQGIPVSQLAKEYVDVVMRRRNETTLDSLRVLQDNPLYFAHGILFFGEPLTDAIREPVDHRGFSVSRTWTNHDDGRPIRVQLESGRPFGEKKHTFLYDVDLTRRSAVTAVIGYQDDDPVFDLAIDHQESAIGWIPKSWRMNIYASNGRIISAHHYEVTDVSFDISDNDYFNMDLPNGTLVKGKDNVVYRVSADGSLMNLNTTAPGDRGGSRLIIFVSAIGAVMVVVYMVANLGKQSQS